MKMRRWLAIVLVLCSILILIGVGFGLYLLSKEPMEDFSFQVLDEVDGTPISGVEITVIERAYDFGYNSNPFLNDYQPFWEKERTSFTTNENGWGNISLKKIDENDGYYRFEFRKEDFLSFSETSIFNEGHATSSWSSTNEEPCNIKFFSSTNLTGYIHYPSGKPVEGVTISVRHRNRIADNFDITGPDGSYLMNGIRAGQTSLTISGPGIDTKHMSVDLEKFYDNHLDIVVYSSSAYQNKVKLKPELTYDGHDMNIPDSDIVILFMAHDKEKDLDYCWGAVELIDGEFNCSVRSGRYQLFWYYLEDEGYNKMEMPVYKKDELEEGKLTILSDRTIEIEIRLEPMYTDI